MKKIWIYFIAFVLFAISSVYHISEQKQVRAEGIEIIGHFYGTLTQASNGGLYCEGSTGICVSVVGDGEKCWLMPYYGPVPPGGYPEKIEISYSELSSTMSKIENGEVFYNPAN